MTYGAISLTIGLGLDGGFIDWGSENSDRWPRPDELERAILNLRGATLVDQATYDRLAVGEAENDPHAIRRCNPNEEKSVDQVLGKQDISMLLRAASYRQFVHVAGGAALTQLALASGLVNELDVTIYPIAGREPLALQTPAADYCRLQSFLHDDGRVKTVWRRINDEG